MLSASSFQDCLIIWRGERGDNITIFHNFVEVKHLIDIMVTYEELVPVPHHRIMLIKVGKVKRENLYEMTRKYWKVSLERAKTSTHVLAVINGIVVAEFIPQKWFITENREEIGRCEFVGKENPDSDYIGRSVKHLYGKSQNPVKYINM